ncbi:MAG TPA: aminodeoxychorismate lyase [Cycloclasticus sp.]|jgi:4-amino-4-deoxychorismate lyase|nr:aminodeoxychorismate lyase [Cycloclasticus sp.]HIL91801.1 aminodeoxychorismate lyase [Cycloclasticus sp.]
MTVKMLINGQADGLISPLDRGFQYGDGLFETILVESGNAVFLSAHLTRLQKGCVVLGFPATDIRLIEREIAQLIGHHEYGVIKIILSRGVGERGFLPPNMPSVTRVISFSAADKGIATSLLAINLTLCKTRLSKQPLLAGIKHLNQLERVLARTELRRIEQVEGLMLDTDGAVIEGTMSNLFMVKDDILITPNLDNCGVSGVIRKMLIEQAQTDKIVCKVEALTLNDIKDADEVFVTNSLMPIRSVTELSIDGTTMYENETSRAQWALDSVLTAMQQQT